MDWNSLISAIIGGLIATIPIIVNNYFQRKHDERLRKWELEDRQINRNLEFRTKRLAEFQELINTYLSASQTLVKLEHDIIASQDLGQSTDSLHLYLNSLEELDQLTEPQLKTMSSFTNFGDKELVKLKAKFMRIYHAEKKNALYLANKIVTSDSFDKEVVLKRLQEFADITAIVYAQMKLKLDVLAQEVS